MRRRLWAKVLERLMDVSAGTLLIWWVAVVIMCALAYQILATMSPEHAPRFADGTLIDHFFESLYFSVITVTTVGYGDILPQGFSRAIAAVEGAIGFALFGLLVGKLASLRQERVTQEVHRHAVNESFSSLREGLFMVRKDLDAAIAHLKHGPLSEEFWEKLTVSHLHAQMLIREIPGFYESGFGTLDDAREVLLVESVRRTVRRLGAFLRAHGAVHNSHGAELSAFLLAVEDVTTAWREYTTTQSQELETVAREARTLRKALDEASVTGTLRRAAHPTRAHRPRRR